MSKLVPNRFLFDFEFPLPYRAQMPELTGKLPDWSDDDLLPYWGDLDGQPAFARLWACWNESGISLACRVDGRTRRLRCDPAACTKGDGLRVCLALRETHGLRRATRHCRQFCFLPTGGGRSGNHPVVGEAPFPRARENPPPAPLDRLLIAADVAPDGYALEAHLPAEALPGFDLAEHPRLGFYYLLQDLELGQQYLTVGDDLSPFVDPSTWATALLQPKRGSGLLIA